MVLWCVAVVVAFALIAGCGPVGPYGVWTERPDTAMVDAGDAMAACITTVRSESARWAEVLVDVWMAA